ncbi:hypothetical protein Aduo_013159 [Ancylostoma duodenale]
MKSAVIHGDGQTTLASWPPQSRRRSSWRDPVTLPLWTVFLPTGVLFLVICLISGLHHIRITNLELRMRGMESRLEDSDKVSDFLDPSLELLHSNGGSNLGLEEFIAPLLFFFFLFYDEQ